MERASAVAIAPPPDRGGLLPPLWPWGDLGAAFAASVGAFAAIAAALWLTVGGGEGAAGLAIAATLAFELTLAAIAVAFAARRGAGLAGLGFARPLRWRPLAAAWVGAYLILLAWRAALLALEALGLPVGALAEGNAIPIEAGYGLPTIALIGVTVAVAAPLGEELLFRGLLFRGMRGYWRFGPAALASGALFGLFHANPGVIVPFALIGVLFAWAYERTGSLWTPLGAHGGVNGVSFAAALALA